MRGTRALAVAAAVALGLVAEAAGPGWDDPLLWLPDLLVGWTLLAAAMLTWWGRSAPAVAALLAATGVAWFVGWSPETLYWHRGPLVHLLLTYPGWRPDSLTARVSVGVGYLAAAVPALWGDSVVAVALSVALVAVVALQARSATRVRRPARRVALTAAAVLAGAVIAASVLPSLLAQAAVLPTLLAYQAAVVAVAVLLVAALPYRSAQALADAVVDLADQPLGSLRARLADAVADPTLELAVWSPTTREFRTDAGRVVDPDRPGPGRDSLVVAREGRPLAALVHDPQALRDADLVEAVSRAVQLCDTNAALKARVDEVYWQVFDSRRRLVLAADEERRTLAGRLRDGPLRLLTALEQALEGLADADADADGGATHGGEPVQRAREHAREAVADLGRLSNGLRPSDLDDGLAAAVERAAARVGAEVRVHLDVDPLPVTLSPDVEVTAYFVVSEALANVSKYAHARQAVVTLSSGPDGLNVSVGDDGVGGARESPGSGLQGLADRLAALGGTFEVRSPPGAGTRVEAALPWQGSA